MRVVHRNNIFLVKFSQFLDRIQSMNKFYPYPGLLNQNYLRELSFALVKVLIPDDDYLLISVNVRKHRGKELRVEIHAVFQGADRAIICNMLFADVIYEVQINEYMTITRWKEYVYRDGIKKLISDDNCLDYERFMTAWHSINNRLQNALLELSVKVKIEYRDNYKEYYDQHYLTDYYWRNILRYWNDEKLITAKETI